MKITIYGCRTSTAAAIGALTCQGMVRNRDSTWRSRLAIMRV